MCSDGWGGEGLKINMLWKVSFYLFLICKAVFHILLTLTHLIFAIVWKEDVAISLFYRSSEVTQLNQSVTLPFKNTRKCIYFRNIFFRNQANWELTLSMLKHPFWWSKKPSHAQLSGTPWTVAHQSPLFMKFSRQEYRSGLLFSSPGDLPNPRIEAGCPALQPDSLPSEPTGKPRYSYGLCQNFRANSPMESSLMCQTLSFLSL